MSKNINRHRVSNKELIEDIRKYGEEILRSPNFMASAENIQHGNISVMRHSIKVAYASLKLSRKLDINVNEKEMVRGALLHDYFLYDWHDEEHCGLHNLHGFYHPGIALENAMAEYTLTDREQDIIKKHMWPLTVKLPKYKESWVVTSADKCVSSLESLRLHQRHTLLRMKRK